MPIDTKTEAPKGIRPAGLDFWMANVTSECERIRHDFAPTPVHDLRVALRRCRSIADGFMALDPHPAWKQMKKESRWLFQRLGALRDTQVMEEWIQRLAPVPDETYFILCAHLQEQENRQREAAAVAVHNFSKKKWAAWAHALRTRTSHVPVESIVFQHLAFERWAELRTLHQQALRNRSQISYHRVRLALKKFRYTIENFLPSRHERWGAGLREMQDLLGEMHDLFVLWQTALRIKALPSEEAYTEWKQRISHESSRRLGRYREKMLGRASLMLAWRSELPGPKQMKDAALMRFRAWSSFRDPDVRHSRRMASLATQIYDGLKSLNLMPVNEIPDGRKILEAAAMAHAVGSGGLRKHQIASYRLIRKLAPLPGLDIETMHYIALVVRFHRGALPRPEQKAFAGIMNPEKSYLAMLSGILRLAGAFDRLIGSPVEHLHLELSGQILMVIAPGYSQNDASAGKLAGARYLLEMACRLPIMICAASFEESGSTPAQ